MPTDARKFLIQGIIIVAVLLFAQVRKDWIIQVVGTLTMLLFLKMVTTPAPLELLILCLGSYVTIKIGKKFS
jgi:hypothetical protein